MNDNLNEDNFLLYCAKHYDNPSCHDVKEFYEDLARIKYIKKLITIYQTGGELKERLILNHLVVLNNVFGPIPLSRILFLKLYDQIELLSPFLSYLNLMPEVVYNIGKQHKNYITRDICTHQEIIQKLKKL